MKANEIKKGLVILVDGHNVRVTKVIVQSPSSRSGSTLYKVTGQNIMSRTKVERSFKGDEIVEDVEFSKHQVQLLFREETSCTFMNSDTYDQYSVDNEMLSEELLYMTDGLEGLQILIADDAVLGVELPGTVILDIVECSPGIKGASASARTKPATLSTGLVVQTPEYLENGERIKINTDTGEYISRA
ncbi:Elongation factor P-like protein [hydrothermal vent metagenome]|uniref:Elongation factor P-like protein n=1 Tax=hydrothermal vent metagenome TaxID=652676 RepID=A0A3B0XUI1_9ZZZZ